MNKRLLAIAIIVGLGALVVAGFYLLNKPNFTQIIENPQKSFAVEKKDLALNEVPGGFPKDLPVEAGSKVSQNYQASTTDGRIQSTRVVTTSDSLVAGVKIYSDFFVNLGWTEIDTESPVAGRVNALFRRKDDTLLVVAYSDATKQNKIELTLTESAPISNQ